MYNSKNIEVFLNTNFPITIPNFNREVETFDSSEKKFNGNEYEEPEYIYENTIKLEKYTILEKPEVFIDNNN